MSAILRGAPPKVSIAAWGQAMGIGNKKYSTNTKPDIHTLPPTPPTPPLLVVARRLWRRIWLRRRLRLGGLHRLRLSLHRLRTTPPRLQPPRSARRVRDDRRQPDGFDPGIELKRDERVHQILVDCVDEGQIISDLQSVRRPEDQLRAVDASEGQRAEDGNAGHDVRADVQRAEGDAVLPEKLL